MNNVFQQISPVGESPCFRGHWASSTACGSCSKPLRDGGPLHRLSYRYAAASLQSWRASCPEAQRREVYQLPTASLSCAEHVPA